MQISFSIVSHAHSQAVCDLLADFNTYSGAHSLHLLLTLNAPELETSTEAEFQQLSRWPLTVIRNTSPKGFASNHNSAFEKAGAGLWCVVNPDIRLHATKLDALLAAVSLKYDGMAYPKQISPTGDVLEFARELVTPWSLLKRYSFRTTQRQAQPDWVSGCFMAFRSEVYQELGGFNEKYFLYCEDVDICLRLQLAGYKMVEADFSIIHDTRRNTLKKFDHFKWHAMSLLKLWCSKAFWAYLWNRSKIKAR
ncbi:glycosyltransferase family 2 protein [Variovorax sp. PCZ-1]|uniref:glycosyltransferase family 2 protein n=1 Tax=Variovorax sp. PCZ-1 TaxID=2835533 RepID=UPI001BD01827|nr:glycosyltransferase family 2 protein [Variovorax sp. PCZ-1]MBS7808216.1 glycosyltransferase [Variovorax sp. PCZ-1]